MQEGLGARCRRVWGLDVGRSGSQMYEGLYERSLNTAQSHVCLSFSLLSRLVIPSMCQWCTTLLIRDIHLDSNKEVMSN